MKSGRIGLYLGFSALIEAFGGSDRGGKSDFLTSPVPDNVRCATVFTSQGGNWQRSATRQTFDWSNRASFRQLSARSDCPRMQECYGFPEHRCISLKIETIKVSEQGEHPDATYERERQFVETPKFSSDQTPHMQAPAGLWRAPRIQYYRCTHDSENSTPKEMATETLILLSSASLRRSLMLAVLVLCHAAVRRSLDGYASSMKLLFLQRNATGEGT